MAKAAVKNLRPGQSFIWVGRVVTFVRAQDHHKTRFGKRWRRLIVQDGDRQHALWYQDHEKVTVVSQPLADVSREA